MSNVATVETNDGLLLVAEDRKTVDALHASARRELARQAVAASNFTGLSVEYCAKMVLYRMAMRMKQEVA